MEKKWWTLVVVCAATFMLLLDVTIVIVALPAIQSGLHATFSDVQWVVDAYALTLASVLLTAGSLADRYGRRLLFTIGLVVFTLGSLLCSVAQSPIMLILSRSAQGVGGAILFATSLALLAQSFHGHERRRGLRGMGCGHRRGRGARPRARRDHHHRHQLAGHLPGEPPDRRGRTGRHPMAGGRVEDTERGATRLGRLRHPHRRPGRPGLRPDPRRRDLLERQRGHHLSRRRRGATGRVRGRGAPGPPPAVRPRAVPHPYVQRGTRRRLRHERFALRHPVVPGPLPAGRPRLLRPRHRGAAAHPERGDAGHGDHRRTAEHPHARPLADRAGPPPA